MEGEPQLSRDELVIAAGIWKARAEDGKIADDTARRIATHLHGGQASALYSLASTGAIDYEQIRQELEAAQGEHSDHVREWIDCLGNYVLGAGARGPVDGWSNL
jgi:hypothetical protein